MTDRIIVLASLATQLVYLGLWPSVELDQLFWWSTVVSIWGIISLFRKNRTPLRPLPLTLLFVWIGYLCLHAFFISSVSWWGDYWRRQGVVFICTGVAWAILLGSSTLTSKWLERAIVSIGLIQIILAIVIGGPRLTGIVGEANSLGLIGMVLALTSSRLGQIFGLITIGLSSSRSAGLGWLAAQFFSVTSKKIIAVGLLFALFIVWIGLLRGDGHRGQLWAQSINLWRDHPWFGIGLGNFQQAFTRHMSILDSQVDWARYDHPHNIVLYWLVSIGSIGAALLVGWLDQLLTKRSPSFWFRLVLALILFGFWQPWSTVAYIYWWTCVGMLLRSDHSHPRVKLV